MSPRSSVPPELVNSAPKVIANARRPARAEGAASAGLRRFLSWVVATRADRDWKDRDCEHHPIPPRTPRSAPGGEAPHDACRVLRRADASCAGLHGFSVERTPSQPSASNDGYFTAAQVNISGGKPGHVLGVASEVNFSSALATKLGWLSKKFAS